MQNTMTEKFQSLPFLGTVALEGHGRVGGLRQRSKWARKKVNRLERGLSDWGKFTDESR